jgi:hypothetical protein
VIARQRFCEKGRSARGGQPKSKDQRTDGSPADPPTYRSTVLAWRQGDTIPLNADRTLRWLASVTTTPTSRPLWS